MYKVLVGVILIFSMLNFTVSPAFAEETQEERDARQSRAVMTALGLVAIVGAAFMLSKMRFSSASNIDEEKLKESKTFAQKQNTEDQRLSAGLDFTSFGIRTNIHDKLSAQSEHELLSPELKLTYAW